MQRLVDQPINRQRPFSNVHRRLSVRRSNVKFRNRRNGSQRSLRSELQVVLDVDAPAAKSVRERTIYGIRKQNPQPRSPSNRNESASFHASPLDFITTLDSTEEARVRMRLSEK